MRILFALDVVTRSPTNPFVVQLIQSLSNQPSVAEVGFGAEVLHWNPSKWDVVHFQWPEAYFQWKKPSAREFARAEAQLMAYKERGGIVVTTVHNHAPKPEFGEMGSRVFDLVYGNTDCFVHLGEASLAAFKSDFRDSSWLQGSNHSVIYHGDYAHYSKGSQDYSLARKVKEFSGPKILVFGALRDGGEERLAREAFKAAGLGPDAVLIFAGKPSRANVSKNILSGNLDKDYGNILRIHRRIEDSQVKPIFDAVDVVLIPRAGRLNSGVIPLAFTYEKLIVAPGESVMGEMVRKGGGVLYSPGCAKSAGEALSRAVNMHPDEKVRLQEKVRSFRTKEMTWESQAHQYASLYSSLLGRPHVRNFRLKRAHIEKFTGDIPHMDRERICFSIALNGYDKRFGPCIDSHQRYCLRRGYKYWCVKSVPWKMTPKQCAWLKVELMRGLLAEGFDMCGFLDADCEFRPHTPAVDDEFSDRHPFLMARGKSGRINSGIMFAKNRDYVLEFLELLISKCDEVVPKDDRTAYENGHFIHYGRDVDFIGELDHIKWNNNTRLDGMSYVQHYSGGDLRRWWEENIQPNLISGLDIKREESGKRDVTNMPISEFLRVAREHFSPAYNELYTDRRRLVV